MITNASAFTNLSSGQLPPPSLPLPLRPSLPPAVRLTSKFVLVAEAELALLLCGIAIVCCMMFVPPFVVVYKRWRKQCEQQQLIDESFYGWRRGGAL